MFTVLAGLLAFGSLWFWIVAIALFFVVVALVENEKTVAAGFCLVASFVVFYLCGNSGMLPWLRDHPLTLLYYSLAYFGAAGIWGVVKWYLFVTNEREKYEEAKTLFLKNNNATELTAALKTKWTEHVADGEYSKSSYSYEKIKFIYPAPEARNYKAKVVGWMTYWPWSAFWTLINDPIRRLMRLIYGYISGLLNRISKHAYRNTTDDIIVPAKKSRAGSSEVV
jgi:hypothetical protein